jgi:Zn-dependent protease
VFDVVLAHAGHMAWKTRRPAPAQSGATGSVRVARLWGIEVRLHWTFLVLVVLVAWVNLGAGAKSVGVGLLWITAVFGSVLVHEIAHCVVARRRGAVVDDILLTPIGGISQLREIPKAAADELAIAIVGPVTSFALAALAGGVGWVTGARMWPPELFSGSWFARLLWLNLLLGAFNMLPALPMDGGRVLRATLARHRDRRTATRLAARVARVLAVMMMVVGLAYDLWFLLIGLFVFLGASAEEQAADAANDDGSIETTSHPRTAPPPTDSTRGLGAFGSTGRELHRQD